MKKIILVLALMIFTLSAQASEFKNLSAKEAMAKLKQGNERFVKHKMKHPHETQSRMLELTNGQHPFVATLSCSDSRVPIEILFDEGLGDIFVIRNAGNVLDEHVIGTIEYAIYHLNINLIVVLGHENCGAVGAAMSEGKEPKEIESIKKAIKPAVEECKKCKNYTYENVIKQNAKMVAQNIKNDKTVKKYLKDHPEVEIVPAYYHLDSGKVEFLQ